MNVGRALENIERVGHAAVGYAVAIGCWVLVLLIAFGD